MLPALSKHTAITAALLASLSLTACGKKKDEMFTAPPATTAQSTDATKVAAKKGATVANSTDTSGQLGAELPDPNSDHLPPVPEPGPVTRTPALPKAPVVKAPVVKAPVVKEAAPKAATPKMPPIVPEATPATVLVKKSEGNSVESRQSTNENSAKRFTGGVGQDGLLYTSSSTDSLLSYLRSRNSRVDATSRRLNLEAAASVVSAKLSVEASTQDAVVTLKVKEGADVKTYVVAGTLSEGEATRVVKIRSQSTGGRAIEGTLKCLDLDGGCQTTFARLTMGSTGSSAIINVVFRQSAADVHVDFAKEQSSSHEFLVFKEFFVNAIERVQNIENKLKSAHMSSFEVVNGRSEVTLSLVGVNKELIAFQAPLLAPEVGSRVNLSLSRVSSVTDSSDLVVSRPKLTYANWIGNARLVANNGLGQVKTALKLRSTLSSVQDQVLVTFARKVKPLVELTDKNLK